MKTVLVLTLTVLAFTASNSLPRDYKPASHEGQKVKGEEGGKQRVDPICSTDDAGHLTCNNLGFCAATGDPSDKFYHCTANADGSFKMQRCKCTDGYVFSDEDASEPCVKTSSLVDWRERLFFSDESETVLYECGKEETTTMGSSNVTTTESSNVTTTESSNVTTTESSNITATETNTDPTENSTAPTEEPPTTTPPTCEKLGSFPDPQDCHKYYQCAIDSSGIMTAENKTCGPKQYFDPQDLICEIGSCINPTTSPPFECQSLGTFPDPADCHRYYICVAGPDGQFKQSNSCKCDDGMYFDPEFGSCAYGTCP